MTGPFTATADLGSPFKVQSQPYALTLAATLAPTPAAAAAPTPPLAQAQAPAPVSDRSGRSPATQVVLIVLAVIIVGALALTFRKKPAP